MYRRSNDLISHTITDIMVWIKGVELQIQVLVPGREPLNSERFHCPASARSLTLPWTCARCATPGAARASTQRC